MDGRAKYRKLATTSTMATKNKVFIDNADLVPHAGKVVIGR